MHEITITISYDDYVACLRKAGELGGVPIGESFPREGWVSLVFCFPDALKSSEFSQWKSDYQPSMPQEEEEEQIFTIEQIGYCYGKSLLTASSMDKLYQQGRHFCNMLSDQQSFDESLFWKGFFRGIASNFPIVP